MRHLKDSNGKSEARRWGVCCLSLGLVCLFLAGDAYARDRQAARQAFSKASEFHRWLDAQPESSQTLRRLQRGIFLYRLVVDHDPTYGAADDALFFMASLYERIGRRFDRPADLRRAAYYFEFVARDYPTTPHRSEALRRAARLRAPPEPAPQVAAAAAPEAVEEAAGNFASLSEVRYWSNPDYTRVVLQLDREIEFERSVLQNPDRLYFDLQRTRLEPGEMDQSYPVNGLQISQIRVGQNRPDVVRVVLDFDRLSQHTVFALYDPFRIVIDTRGPPRTAEELAEAESDASIKTAEAVISLSPEPDRSATLEEIEPVASPARTSSGDLTMTRTLGLKVGRVVIDPGHGGKDTGSIGPSGLVEKELVLDVALRLRRLLRERLGTDVIMTRGDDRFVPLEERTAIANKNNADLFVSIHANWWHRRDVSGVETYVLDFATNAAEREIASRENASAQRTIRELEGLLKQIAMEDYNRESRELAQIVQDQLYLNLKRFRPGHHNRGVKQAPFIVLIGSNMPSILTEIGFISNPEDETYFRTEESREHVAEALYKGIEAYFRTLGSAPDRSRAAAASSP